MIHNWVRHQVQLLGLQHRGSRLSGLLAILAVVCLLGCSSCATTTPVIQPAESAAAVSRNSRIALGYLYETNHSARLLGQNAQAILVFPRITKGGFLLGGMGGNGTLFQRGRPDAYFQIAGLSYGFQAGVQEYGYAMLMMDQAAVARFRSSGGWEIGSAPGLVVVDEGFSGSLSTTTVQNGIYVFSFHQKGLMGGISAEGSKITQIFPR